MPLTRKDWPQALHDLARQLDDGRVYDRDLLYVADALGAVLDAYNRRPYVRSGVVEEQRRARARQQARPGALP
ncbi:hypothetical protein [Modestobacter sp. URMC 112]